MIRSQEVGPVTCWDIGDPENLSSRHQNFETGPKSKILQAGSGRPGESNLAPLDSLDQPDPVDPENPFFRCHLFGIGGPKSRRSDPIDPENLCSSSMDANPPSILWRFELPTQNRWIIKANPNENL
jgi:hypothetical protein